MKSHNDAQAPYNKDMNVMLPCSPKYTSGKEIESQSKETSTKKRSRKTYTKKSKKLEE
jgi:hypothetical protein